MLIFMDPDTDFVAINPLNKTRNFCVDPTNDPRAGTRFLLGTSRLPGRHFLIESSQHPSEGILLLLQSVSDVSQIFRVAGEPIHLAMIMAELQYFAGMWAM